MQLISIVTNCCTFNDKTKEITTRKVKLDKFMHKINISQFVAIAEGRWAEVLSLVSKKLLTFKSNFETSDMM